MRLFVAIPISAKVRSELETAVGRLKPQFAGLRGSPPESWHITLQFLGNTTADQLQPLISQLHTIQVPALPVRLGNLGAFDRAGVFMVNLLVSHELLALHQSIVAATARCGFIAESRPYHPHITLARTKGEAGKRSLKALRDPIVHQPRFSSFVAREFLLFESFLESSGARYEIREHFPLS